MSRPRLAVALFFLGAGSGHFTWGRGFFEDIVPSWVPGTAEQVNLLAGAAEVVGGVLVLLPGAERLTRAYLVALLVAVFPANIQMAVAPDTMPGARGVPGWALWARLPLQGVAILCVLRAVRPQHGRSGARGVTR